jgi:hypothetical protein
MCGCTPDPTRPRLLESDWAIWGKCPANVSIAQSEVEPLRIEVATNPAFVIGVLGMATIGQTLEEASVAVRATDILGWSCTSAVDTSRDARRGFHDQKLLELHKVMPVVTEVVDVHELDLFASAEVEELHLALVVDARVTLELGLDEIGIAERQAADLKLVQVVVPPAECSLDDLVQLTEVERARHDQAPPDRWLDLLESDAYLDRSRDLEHDSAVCPAAARRL